MAQIQVAIVTPEATTFDAAADSVIVPLIDGQKGVLPGHAAMIGRLGPGELAIKAAGAVERFYVDGGFVQITGNSVSVLTGRSVPAAEIDLNQARADLERARSQPSDNAELMELKQKAIAQATAQIRISENS